MTPETMAKIDAIEDEIGYMIGSILALEAEIASGAPWIDVDENHAQIAHLRERVYAMQITLERLLESE